MSRDEATFFIRDEGPGFDSSILPDPGEPGVLEREGGRGLALMQTFVDDVACSEKGNEVTLLKRRKKRLTQPAEQIRRIHASQG